MTVVSIAIVSYAWATGPRKVLWATGARPLGEPTTPEEKQLANVVEEMAIASGLPVPEIYLVGDPDPNAFATGWSDQSSAIVVTEGMLRICSRDELQAVIGHEMGHIKNLDVRMMTLLAALVGAVALIHDVAARLLRDGSDSSLLRSSSSSSSSSRSSDDKGRGRGAIVLIVAVVWLVSILFAPLITRLIALAVSRKREFLADAMSAQFTRNPGALANALEKIDGAEAPTTSIRGGVAHLCIADPLGRAVNGRSGFFADLFGTHRPSRSAWSGCARWRTTTAARPPRPCRPADRRNGRQTTSAASGSNVVRFPASTTDAVGVRAPCARFEHLRRRRGPASPGILRADTGGRP